MKLTRREGLLALITAPVAALIAKQELEHDGPLAFAQMYPDCPPGDPEFWTNQKYTLSCRVQLDPDLGRRLGELHRIERDKMIAVLLNDRF